MYQEMKKQCVEAGVRKTGSGPEAGSHPCGVDTGVECCEESCPSLKYWQGNDRGRNKKRAIDVYNLEQSFKEEIGDA